MKLGDIPFDGLFYLSVRYPNEDIKREAHGFAPEDVPEKYRNAEVIRLYPCDDAVYVEINGEDHDHKDTLEFIVKSWVYNLDVEPYPIDLEIAKEYATYITPGTCSDTVTPEKVLDLWNKIVKE